MKKILLFSSILFGVFLASSFSAVLATDGNMNTAGQSIQNVAEGARSVVQNAVSGAENAVAKGGQAVANTTQNMTNAGTTKNTTNTGNTIAQGTTNYNTTRTATDTTAKFAGMTATGWTWFIVAILGALIVGFVWYYAKQPKENYKSSER